MIGTAGIRALLPHRFPVLLVDRVTQLTADRLTAVKAVTCNEPWFADGAETYPPTLLVESWVQAAALLAAHGPAWPGGVLLLGSVSKVVFGAPVRPGELVRHHVELTRNLGDTAIFEGESRVDDRIALRVGGAVLAARPAGVLDRAEEKANA